MRFLANRIAGASAATAASLLALLTLACATTRAPSSPLPEPPAASAPIAARDAYYQENRPAAVEETSYTLVSNGVEAPEGYRLLRLQLANGDHVTAHGLLVAVPANSVTATAVAAAESAEALWTVASWVGLAGFVGGLGSGVVLFFAAGPLVALAGGGALFLAGAVATGVSFYANQQAANERERAFRCFDRDLRVRLDLPQDEPQLAGCTP